MGMFDDIFAGSNGVASQLLSLMGVSNSTFKHITEGTYDPRTDTMTGETTTTTTVTTSPALKYSAYEAGAFGISQEDCKIIGSGVDFPLICNKRDTVTVNGVEYIIISNKPIYSGTSLAAVVMQCRRQDAGSVEES